MYPLHVALGSVGWVSVEFRKQDNLSVFLWPHTVFGPYKVQAPEGKLETWVFPPQEAKPEMVHGGHALEF